MKRLNPEQWRAIRQAWEYDPDRPSYPEAAAAAAKRHEFKAPSRQAVQKRAQIEGWVRRGSLDGLDAAAHLLADRLGAERKPAVSGGGTAYHDADAKPDSVTAELAERREAEMRRAAVRARHREEWVEITALRKEALDLRESDLEEAFDRAKLAKIMAESLSIQQAGEVKCWGMHETICSEQLRTMTDAQLERVVAGQRLS